MYQRGAIWHLACGLPIQGGCNPAPEMPWKGLTFQWSLVKIKVHISPTPLMEFKHQSPVNVTKPKSFSVMFTNPGDFCNLLESSCSIWKLPRFLSLCPYMFSGAPGWRFGTNSYFRATVMKSSGWEVPEAATLYRFLFNLVAQMAEEIPPPSVIPTPALQVVFSCSLATVCGFYCRRDFYNDPSLEKKKLKLKNRCFSIAHSRGLAYSFAPFGITSENWSR